LTSTNWESEVALDSPGRTIDWSYVAGFFDGEGSITVDARPGLGVLVIYVTFSQKYRPLFDDIARFLRQNGIACQVCRNGRKVHEIRIRTIENVCKLLRKLTLELKQNQAHATIDYYEGRITGNQLLQVFDIEYRMGRRRSSPLKPGMNYPLTHTEALQAAQRIRASATRAANLIYTHESLISRVEQLPIEFTRADAARILSRSDQTAYYIIRRMEANGLVSCRIVGTRGHGKLVCLRTWGR
jgi:LAGLIDADG DNA endonuclease family protein